MPLSPVRHQAAASRAYVCIKGARASRPRPRRARLTECTLRPARPQVPAYGGPGLRGVAARHPHRVRHWLVVVSAWLRDERRRL